MITCLIVDDEFLALNVLEEYIKQVPQLILAAKTKSPIEALEILQSQQIDLLFLDIQMPQMKGTNLLKTLPKPPVTIFTTAYPQYAVEAYDLNAVDYLTKPFSFDRFLQAINKAQKIINPAHNGDLNGKQKDYLLVKADHKLIKIPHKDIKYIEGFREYVRIVKVNGEKILFLESMKNLEAELPSSQFLRVHKSYIISKSFVKSVSGSIIQMVDCEIPIGRTLKEDVMKHIFD